MTTGQSAWPRDTLDLFLRDHERRITQMERRPQGGVLVEAALLAVATVEQVTDPGTAYLVVADGLIHVGGATMTRSEWLATH